MEKLYILKDWKEQGAKRGLVPQICPGPLSMSFLAMTCMWKIFNNGSVMEDGPNIIIGIFFAVI